MYDAICRRVLAGNDGDSVESLRSTALMLTLEEELRGRVRVQTSVRAATT
jgi:hypothetical protein